MTNRERRELALQFARYVVVGGLAFVVDFGILTLSQEWLHCHYLLGNALGFCSGLVVNYFLSIRWVFHQRRLRQPLLEFAIFALLGLIGLAINELSMYVLVGIFSIHYQVAKVVSAAVSLVWNFGARKFVLFHRSES